MNLDSVNLAHADSVVEFRALIAPEIAEIDAAALAEMVRVSNVISRETTGDGDSSMTLEEVQAMYAPNPDTLIHRWLVVLDGQVVGRFGVDIPQEPGSTAAYGMIELLAAVAGRGIGSAAHEVVESVARRYSRTSLQTFVDHLPMEGEKLMSPTGFGSVPLDRATRFLQRHGYRLEQIERGSALDLTAAPDRWEQMLEAARPLARGYRLVQWELPTPAEYIAGYAWLKSRMSTDAPTAELDIPEEIWDESRVVRHDERYLASENTMLVTAAQHIGTGELCGFSEIRIGRDHEGVSHQEDTLVLKEHRGHRLGTVLKCAGLLAWRRRMPGSPRIRTWNAEENRPMLSINEAMGYEPRLYASGWQKRLTL